MTAGAWLLVATLGIMLALLAASTWLTSLTTAKYRREQSAHAETKQQLLTALKRITDYKLDQVEQRRRMRDTPYLIKENSL